MKVFQSRVFAACVASAVTAVVVGGVAFAAIPASNGVITGCYNKKTGALRVIDSPKKKCPSSTKQLKWNQKGLAGAKGATGSSGVANGCGTFPRAGVNWSVAGAAPGHGCDMSGATLSTQNLTNANLTNANFTDVSASSLIMTGANITGANLNFGNVNELVSGGLVGTPEALPPGVVIIGGYLIGGFLIGFNGGTSLSGENLTGFNLSHVDLRNVDLTNANLTNANLNGANTAGTFNNQALGATFVNTTCPDGTNSDSHGNTCVSHGF